MNFDIEKLDSQMASDEKNYSLYKLMVVNE